MSAQNRSSSVLLGLDTSGPRLQLALQIDKTTHQFLEEIARGHAEILFERLDRFLADHAISHTQISKIMTTTGPGSFTGLRIGIAAARGLGLARNIPVCGLPNLLALSLEQKKTDFSIVVDARRGQFYAQQFLRPGLPAAPPELIDQRIFDEKYAPTGIGILTDPKVDMQAALEFCAQQDATAFPPVPTYVREADAKPQSKLRIARI